MCLFFCEEGLEVSSDNFNFLLYTVGITETILDIWLCEDSSSALRLSKELEGENMFTSCGSDNDQGFLAEYLTFSRLPMK